MNEWSRLELLIGKEKIEKLKQKSILILGVGGVGSSAVEHLTRNGIGKIILVDCDKIDITNLNRQIMTTHSNIGDWKVDVLEKRIKDISPSTEVITIKEKITEENIELLYREHVDYMIDACDTIPVKKELIRKNIKYHIPFISCMGTGNRLDPTKLQIVDIRKTSYDPIAKIIRKMIRDEKINEKVMVVTSTEVPIKREKIIASSSFVPSTAGMLTAFYVVSQILKEDIHENK